MTKAYWINTFRAISDPARSNGNSTSRRAADATGLPAVRPHELRHTGAALAAATGASTKEPSRRTTTIRSSPSSSRRDPMGHLWITTARR